MTVKISNEAGTILQRIAAGDKTAVAECLDAYSSQVWYLARKYENNFHDREDAVQEIFLSIWRNAHVFDSSKACESTFIGIIARRHLISRVRIKYRTPRKSTSESALITYASNFHILLQRTVETEFAAVILNNLPSPEKQILQMSIYDGMSHREIAEKLNIPLGTVKTKIRRRLNKIRQQFLGTENTNETASFSRA